MADPKTPGFDERREQLVKFVVMPGRAMGALDREAGKPCAWFVRPEGSSSARIDHQPDGSLMAMIVELYGEKNMDYFASDEPDRTSDKTREEAQAYADLLNKAEVQEKIRDIVNQRAKLAEAIKQKEAMIQAEVEALAATLGCWAPEPRGWEVTSKE